MRSTSSHHDPPSVPGGTSRSTRLLLTTALLAGFTMRLLVMFRSAPLDDAYITFRYVRNLAAGLGFVYNAGERVLGTTTPLWTLLLTPIAALGLPLDTFAVGLGIFFDLLVCWLLFRFLARHVDVAIASLAACFYATFYALVAACGYGMETQFFMLLVLLAFTWSVEGRPSLAAAAAGAATLTRPEGLLLAGILVLALLGQSLRQRRLTVPWSAVALYAGILLVWSIAATLYFGSPLPNSVLAKMHIAGMGPADWWRFFFVRNPLVLLLWVLGAFGTVLTLRRENNALRLFAAWTFTYVLFFLVGDPAFFAAWYFPPLALSLLVLAAAGLQRLTRSFIEQPARRAWLAGLLWMLGMFFLLPRTLDSSQAAKRAADQVYRPLAQWLRQESDPDDVVFAGDVGYLGYYSERPVLDSAALVSPEVWRFYAEHPEDPLRDVRFILERRPTFVVLSMGFGAYGHLRDSDFSSAYVAVRRFNLRGDTELQPQEDPAVRYRQDPGRLIADYLVFKRRP